MVVFLSYMSKMTFKRALGLLSIAGAVYAGGLFAFLNFYKSDAAPSIAAAAMCPVSDSQNQNQMYFVGCGGFF